MYFAQQEHLIKYGRGVFDDSFYALRHGPVPSFTYKAIQVNQGKIEGTEDLNIIAQAITVSKNNMISTGETADMDEFSLSDIRCLDNSICKYKDTGSYDLSDLSHDEAWSDAYTRSQDDPEKNKMTLIDIAKAGKAAPDIINQIRESEQIRRALLY